MTQEDPLHYPPHTLASGLHPSAVTMIRMDASDSALHTLLQEINPLGILPTWNGLHLKTNYKLTIRNAPDSSVCQNTPKSVAEAKSRRNCEVPASWHESAEAARSSQNIMGISLAHFYQWSFGKQRSAKTSKIFQVEPMKEHSSLSVGLYLHSLQTSQVLSSVCLKQNIQTTHTYTDNKEYKNKVNSIYRNMHT